MKKETKPLEIIEGKTYKTSKGIGEQYYPYWKHQME